MSERTNMESVCLLMRLFQFKTHVSFNIILYNCLNRYVENEYMTKRNHLNLTNYYKHVLF